MLNKKILISIVIVLVIGVAAASYQAASKTPGVWQSGISESQLPTEQGSSVSDGSSSALTTSGSGIVKSGSQSSTSSGQSGSSGSDVQITAAKAKTIAQDNIKDSTATAGTPELTVIDGKTVYNVPVMSNNEQVGYFVINAQTGTIIEGAGGAPNG